MYGSKVGPAAATGLGAGAASYSAGGWLYAALALVAILGVMLIVRPMVLHRRHMALGMTGNGKLPLRKRMHMRRRG